MDDAAPPDSGLLPSASGTLEAWNRYATAQDAADQARDAIKQVGRAEYEGFWHLQSAAIKAFGVYRQEFARAIECVPAEDQQATAARLLETVAEAMRLREPPLVLASVTDAIRDINTRSGYPERYAVPCPGHMTHQYAPREGITVDGEPGAKIRRMRIAGSLVGIVSGGWGPSATCLLPHTLDNDLRLFNCASAASALNGLQLHALTSHAPGPAGLPGGAPRFTDASFPYVGELPARPGESRVPRSPRNRATGLPAEHRPGASR